MTPVAPGPLVVVAAGLGLFLTPAPARTSGCGPIRHRAPIVAVVKKDAIVVKEVPVLAKFVAVLPVAEFPTYGAYYTPPAVAYVPQPAPQAAAVTPPPAQAQAASASDLKLVLEALKALDGRLGAVEARLGGRTAPAVPAPAAPAPAVPTPAPADPFNPAAVPQASGQTEPRSAARATSQPGAELSKLFQTRCAACHEAATSAEKGGGFTLMEGAELAKLDERQVRRLASVSYKGSMPPKSSGLPALTDAEVALVMQYVDGLK